MTLVCCHQPYYNSSGTRAAGSELGGVRVYSIYNVIRLGFDLPFGRNVQKLHASACLGLAALATDRLSLGHMLLQLWLSVVVLGLQSVRVLPRLTTR